MAKQTAKRTAAMVDWNGWMESWSTSSRHGSENTEAVGARTVEHTGSSEHAESVGAVY